MTTTLGFKAYDPKLNLNYVLLAADTRVTQLFPNTHIVLNSFNTRKIIYNFQKDVILACSGEFLNVIKFNSKTKTSLKYLDNSTNLSRDELIKNLNTINEQFETNWIIAFREKDKMSLLTKDYSENDSISLDLVCSSSGPENIYKFIKLEAKKRFNLKDKQNIVFPLKDMFRFSCEVLQKATEQDKFTGGILILQL